MGKGDKKGLCLSFIFRDHEEVTACSAIFLLSHDGCHMAVCNGRGIFSGTKKGSLLCQGAFTPYLWRCGHAVDKQEQGVF